MDRVNQKIMVSIFLTTKATFFDTHGSFHTRNSAKYRRFSRCRLFQMTFDFETDVSQTKSKLGWHIDTFTHSVAFAKNNFVVFLLLIYVIFFLIIFLYVKNTQA